MNETSSQNKTTNEVPNPSFGSIMSETFTKLFVWNARSTRKTFWLGYLVIAIINFVVYQVTMVLPESCTFSPDNWQPADY